MDRSSGTQTLTVPLGTLHDATHAQLQLRNKSLIRAGRLNRFGDIIGQFDCQRMDYGNSAALTPIHN